MEQKILAIHKDLVRIAQVHLTSEAELISHLQEFDKIRGYLHFDCNSLHVYCVVVLKLSDATAYNLTTIARKAVHIPALKSAIEVGELSVSKARKIVPVINNENQNEWLALAKESTSREIEKAVAKAQPKFAVKESVKYVAENRISLTVGLSEETIQKLSLVVDLESQRTKKPASREDALVAALESYLEKNDPIRRAKSAAARLATNQQKFAKQQLTTPVPGQEQMRQPRQRQSKCKTNNRSTLPSAVVHAVHLRDQRQCTFKDSANNRCGATRWLDIHHIIPRAYGGKDELENLTTLCASHHRHVHR